MSTLRRYVALNMGKSEGRGVRLNLRQNEPLVPLSGPLLDNWIDSLLSRVTIRSNLLGRIRFHLDFRSDEVLGDTLRRELQKLDGVRLDSFSVRTRTALVTFDPARAEALTVATALLRGIEAFATNHGECDLNHHHHDARGSSQGHGADEDCDHDHSAIATDAGIRKELFKLTATGAVLAYFVYKKLRGAPMRLAFGPISDVKAILTIATGYPIFRSGVDSLRNKGKATDDTLITIAVIATLLMGESLTGLSVVWLINLGKLLEAITLKRSRTAIKELMDIAPLDAWLVTGSGASPKRVAVETLEKGQIMRIFAGEKVPLDGTIIDGEALVREAFLTGEAMPTRKQPGAEVYAGSLLESGQIDVRVRNLVTETVVARMIDAIENVRANKAPIEKVGNRFAAKFIPISIGISVVTLVLTGDLRRAITMLVIACPCAAGLATPTAVSASIGQAARRGILIKGGTHVEAASHIDTVVFDKTGTLTAGHPTVQEFISARPTPVLSYYQCLAFAAAAETHSTHPLAQCLINEAKKENLELAAVRDFTTIPGKGIAVVLEGGQNIHVGSKAYMRQIQVQVPSHLSHMALAEKFLGDSLVYLAREDEFLGVFVVQDQIRSEAAATLEKIRALGVKRIILATGDQAATARYVANILGIDEVHSEMLPADKLKLVESLKQSGHKIAMVGDGVNDAQALSAADLSIAMGAGRCDVAIETADITLARDDLQLLAETLDISQRTLRTIHQNLFFSVGINALGVGYGALGKLSPFAGAIVHNASTIAVILNSFKLGRDVAKANPLTLLKEIKI